MPMNSSGPISLGGATAGQSINLEIGSPATSTVSLNDTLVRTLAGVVTGQIVIPTDFYGKSISNSFFQVFANISSGETGGVLNFDPSQNYNISSPAADIFCNSSGTVTSSRLYNSIPVPAATANFYWTKGISSVSKTNPANLLLAGSSTVTNAPTPASNTRQRGTAGVFAYSTNTFVNSTHKTYWTSPSPTPAAVGLQFHSIRNFPNGNIVVTVAGDRPRTSGFATFNSTLGDISQATMVGSVIQPAIRQQLVFYDASPTIIATCWATQTGPVNGSYLTAYLDATTGAISSALTFGTYPSATSSLAYETYSPTIGLVSYQSSLAPAGGDNKYFLGQYNRSSLTFNYAKKFTGASTVGVNRVSCMSKNFTSTGNSLLMAEYALSPSVREAYLVNVDNAVNITNRYSVTINGLKYVNDNFTHIEVRNNQYWIVGYAPNQRTFLLVIPEDLSKLASGLTVTLDTVTIVITPVSDPGFLNLSPASMSVSNATLSNTSFVTTGTPNPFNYVNNSITQTKTNI